MLCITASALLMCALCGLTSAKSFDWVLANTTVALCQYAYCDSGKYLSQQYGGYTKGFIPTLAIDNEKDVQGFVGYNDQDSTIYVSYRGSTSIQDWINNLDAVTTDYPLCDGCLVHKGFYDAEQSAIEEIKSAVSSLTSKYPSYEVVVTGHSLGAAMALLTSLDLLKSGIVTGSNLRLINYGSPRVGNTAFSDFASGQLTDRNRVTHYKDIVPHVPMHERFTHISGEWYQDEYDTVNPCEGAEDINCSYQWNLTNIDDHLHYLTFPISECPN